MLDGLVTYGYLFISLIHLADQSFDAKAHNWAELAPNGLAALHVRIEVTTHPVISPCNQSIQNLDDESKMRMVHL
jgi:hypothetical protein